VTDLLRIIAIGVLLGGIYALVSVGLNLIFGVIRVVNFAQGEFVMLGMYGTYAAYATLGMNPYLAVLLVVPALFVLGVVVQRVILAPLRHEPSMQIFATFGLLLLLQNVVLAVTGGTAYSVTTPVAQISVGVGSSCWGRPPSSPWRSVCSSAAPCWAGRSVRWHRTGRRRS